jgi:predicted Rossmann fold nucleotide-binding protein DprA/Smf involved in DNA uptake
VSRLGIVGSRHFPDLDRVAAYVRGLPAGASLVTGSASGVDAMVARVARERGLPVRVIGASFEEAADAGAAATRNQRFVDLCDVLVAFWDGSSSGTRRTVERALDAGREVHVFTAAAVPTARSVVDDAGDAAAGGDRVAVDRDRPG